jgi:hypothetical protein
VDLEQVRPPRRDGERSVNQPFRRADQKAPTLALVEQRAKDGLGVEARHDRTIAPLRCTNAEH